MLGKLGRNQRGDTIVEVMVVLAVLGLAIGIAYATANRSLLNARQAQESSQGSAAAQAQVEQLVSIGCTSGNQQCDITNSANPGYKLLHPPGGGPFCIVDGEVKPSTDPLCPQQAPLPGSQVQITCLNSCASPRVFEVSVSWDDVLGQGRDTVTQDYVLPANAAAAAGGGGGGGAVASCPGNSSGYSDRTVTGNTTGTVWGTGPYTDDSSVATAAVHAGLISAGQTAIIRVCALPGQSNYGSSTSNGVTTRTWGSWPGSISLILLSGG